jgi:hypothetical protein
MSRKRGRPSRHYRLRVRTERRDPIDYAALARAALEQAAMDQASHADDAASPSSPSNAGGGQSHCKSTKEVPRDRLA